jgi:hypothetical protein
MPTVCPVSWSAVVRRNLRASERHHVHQIATLRGKGKRALFARTKDVLVYGAGTREVPRVTNVEQCTIWGKDDLYQVDVRGTFVSWVPWGRAWGLVRDNKGARVGWPPAARRQRCQQHRRIDTESARPKNMRKTLRRRALWPYPNKGAKRDD